MENERRPWQEWWDGANAVTLANAVPIELTKRIRALVDADSPARSYQGLVQPELRNTRYAHVSADLEEQVFQCVGDRIEVAVARVPDQAALVYAYPEGVGFAPHHDEVTEVERERSLTNGQPVVEGDLTCVIFLSKPAEYGGGELEFSSPSRQSLKPQRGDAIVFPAVAEWIHAVRPITHGERVTMVVRYQMATSSHGGGRAGG